MRLDVGAISASMATDMSVATSAISSTMTASTASTPSCKCVEGKHLKKDKSEDREHPSNCDE